MGIITNIKSLHGMGIYADRGARSPSLQFRRFNLIYGFNGSGKSTLSRVFASLEAGEPHPKLPEGGSFEVAMDDGSAFGCPTNPAGLKQRLLVFNSDYIENNLQWSVGRANPVFYIGADQAEAAADLTRIEGEIVKTEVKKEAAAAAERAAEKTFANFKRECARSVASRLHLGSRKYEAPALAKDYETWKDDQGAPLTDDELKAAEDTRRLDEPMPRLAPVSFDKATIGTAYRFTTDVCGQSLAQVALDEVQRHPDMLLWLKQGHEYHEKNGVADCIHCGNPISPERRKLLAAALDDSVDQFVARLTTTAARLAQLVDTTTQLASQLPASNDLSAELRAGFKDARDDASKEVRLLVKQLGTLQTVLTAKRERPATPADMHGVAAEADVLAAAERLAAIVATVNEAIAAHNQAVADFTKRKDAAETSITAVRQAEVTAQHRMLDRVSERFDLWPERLVADASYGSAENLAALVHERGIEPHIPVFDKSARTDGTFARSDFTYDHKHDRYTCPGGKELKRAHRNFATPRSGVDQDGFIRYRASKHDCSGCSLKPRCCPGQPARKVPRSIHEGARDMARDLALTDAYATSRRERKKIEMLFAHLKRILKLDRLRLRGPNGAKDEFLLAATAQNLRKLAKLIPAPRQPAIV